MKDVFERIFESNAWLGAESRSGEGSDGAQTRILRRELPHLLRRLGVRSLVDAPCGDFNWMRHVALDARYVGMDIVPDIIHANRRDFASPDRRFEVGDLTREPLPAADAILCRDCLVHLSYEDVWRALRNLRASGARWILTTTFPGRTNEDIETGRWRPLDLCAEPFRLPAPADLLIEGCTEWDGQWSDKSLGIWRAADLPPP